MIVKLNPLLFQRQIALRFFHIVGYLVVWISAFFPFHQRCAMCMEQKARCSEYYINVINVYFSSHCRIYCSFIHGSVVLDDEDDGGGDDMQARQWSRCNFKGEKVICQKHL